MFILLGAEEQSTPVKAATRTMSVIIRPIYTSPRYGAFYLKLCLFRFQLGLSKPLEEAAAL